MRMEVSTPLRRFLRYILTLGSKHMDKHERPYKCTFKGCEKIRGFTYGGGLLRHEREVHKMHGGTKKSLYCPFHDCKRSSGAGFTRKENLAEHIRRVHRRISMSADITSAFTSPDETSMSADTGIKRKRAASDSDRGDDEMRGTSVSADTTLKLPDRKRNRAQSISDGGDEERWKEIDQLKQDNEKMFSRLETLEQSVMAGLMNSIVVRGICDYADSHEYAAETAAGYAKKVLLVIPPAEVAKSRTAENAVKPI
jgi:hypothetical protein